jgi:predicted O-methyltransferase YrrM
MRELATNYSKKALQVIRERGISVFLKVAATNAIQLLSIPLFSRRMGSITRERGLGEVVDFAFKGGFSLIRPFQIRSEILGLLTELEKKRPNNIIEIGTARGGTLFLFTRIAADNASLISIDQMDKNYLGGYPEWKTKFFTSFAQKGQKIHLLRADSHDIATLNDAKSLLGGNKVDLLFIDGDHTYSGVKRDFEIYSPLVCRGGIVAFHDIGRPKEGVQGVYKFGVYEFWEEIKDEFNHKEIIEDRAQGWAGIGLLYIK